MVYKYKVQLETMNDVNEFVALVNVIHDDVNLTTTDGRYTISAKSLLGVIATTDWSDTWVVSESDRLYNLIKRWVI